MRARGRAISARQIANIRCSPPDIEVPLWTLALGEDWKEIVYRVEPLSGGRRVGAARRNAKVLLDRQHREDSPPLHAMRDAEGGDSVRRETDERPDLRSWRRPRSARWRR
jgi:hypothetical protein